MLRPMELQMKKQDWNNCIRSAVESLLKITYVTVHHVFSN